MTSKGQHRASLITLPIVLFMSQGCARILPTAEPTAAPEPQAISIEPLETATMIRLESWSPDGRIFSYWTFDAEQLFDFSYPPGTLHFLDGHTGEICSYPYATTYAGHTSLAWQPDGKVAVLASDPPRLGTPCSNDFAVITDPTSIWTNLPDSFVSPGGGYQANTKVLDATSYLAETSILNIRTGEVENTIQWQYRDAIGAPGGGQWVAANQFLINENLDQGPLLVTVGKGITRVSPELFGQASECGEDCYLVARGSPVSGSDNYHLALFGVGNVSSFPQIQLYHSEADEVEELPFQQGGFFSPNGEWFVLYDELIDAQKSQQFQIWLRPVDPMGSLVSLLATTDTNPLPITWSPDSTKLAIPSSTGFKVFMLSTNSLLGAWNTEGYKSIELLWSPDSQSLALRGNIPFPGSQEALFLAHIP